jgi:C_GCAxxG_C_C family probable redox protein
MITAFGPEAGLPQETAVKLGSAFGGGLGRTGEVCGVLTGATMILGLYFGSLDATNPKAREPVYALTQELLQRFRAARGQVTCRELINCDLSTPAGYQSALDRGVLKDLCPKLAQDAAVILADIIKRER